MMKESAMTLTWLYKISLLERSQMSIRHTGLPQGGFVVRWWRTLRTMLGNRSMWSCGRHHHIETNALLCRTTVIILWPPERPPTSLLQDVIHEQNVSVEFEGERSHQQMKTIWWGCTKVRSVWAGRQRPDWKHNSDLFASWFKTVFDDSI